MMQANSCVNWHALIWRFEVDKDKISVDASEGFLAEAIKERAFIYALVFSLTRVDDKPKLVIVLQFIADMSDCFDLKEAAKLSEHDEDDHAIDLVFGVESSHGSLYSLSEKELDVL